MANFSDPLWGDEPWGGPLGPSTTFTFPPADPNEERNRIDIDQIRASVKSGGKSVDASQFVTTVNPGPDGGGGMWQGKNWVYSTVAAIPGNGLVTVFVNGAEVATDGAPLINSGSLATFLINGA